MRKRLLFSAFLTAVLSFSAMQPLAYAENISAASLVEPYYSTDVWTDTDLEVQGTTAICYSAIRAEDAVKITAVQTLYQQGFLWVWRRVEGASWTKTVSADNMSMKNTATGLSSGMCRLETVFTLTLKNGKTETVTVYAS